VKHQIQDELLVWVIEACWHDIDWNPLSTLGNFGEIGSYASFFQTCLCSFRTVHCPLHAKHTRYIQVNILYNIQYTEVSIHSTRLSICNTHKSHIIIDCACVDASWSWLAARLRPTSQCKTQQVQWIQYKLHFACYLHAIGFTQFITYFVLCMETSCCDGYFSFETIRGGRELCDLLWYTDEKCAQRLLKQSWSLILALESENFLRSCALWKMTSRSCALVAASSAFSALDLSQQFRATHTSSRAVAEK